MYVAYMFMCMEEGLCMWHVHVCACMKEGNLVHVTYMYIQEGVCMWPAYRGGCVHME